MLERLRTIVPPLEGKKSEFELLAEEITSKGRDLHEQNHGSKSEDPKTYHGIEHPKSVEARALKIAKVLGLLPEQIALLQMAVAYHD